MIGGNNWDKDRERVKSSSSSGELVKALAELFHHCQSPWGLSLSSVQPPTSPCFPSISLSPSFSLSLSPTLVCIHAIFLSLWSPLCLVLSDTSLCCLFLSTPSPACLSTFSTSVRQSIPYNFSLSLLILLLLFFFLCVGVSLFLSLLPPNLSGQWQYVGVGRGIDLTLCCSSHRAVWHSAYVMQMSVYVSVCVYVCVCVCVAFYGLDPSYCPLPIHYTEELDCW